MKNAMFVLCFVPFLTMPALADSVNAGKNAIVVAEDVHVGVGGVRIDGGERNRHRDHGVVIGGERHHHHDQDRDHDRR
jgi:hypothetical protein